MDLEGILVKFNYALFPKTFPLGEDVQPGSTWEVIQQSRTWERVMRRLNQRNIALAEEIYDREGDLIIWLDKKTSQFRLSPKVMEDQTRESPPW